MRWPSFNKASELAPEAVLPYQHRGEVLSPSRET